MTQDVPNKLGNYRLIREIGRGGFATVYLAKHVHLKAYAAVKVLHGMNAETELFRREAQTLMDLRHPNIIRVLDFGIEEQMPYLITDYAPYGSLRQEIPHSTVVPIASILSPVHQIASALQYAHERKIVHRDVKPENMLLGAQRNVLLSDFGIALVADSRTQEMAGTIAYIAPEQIKGKPNSASCKHGIKLSRA